MMKHRGALGLRLPHVSPRSVMMARALAHLALAGGALVAPTVTSAAGGAAVGLGNEASGSYSIAAGSFSLSAAERSIAIGGSDGLTQTKVDLGATGGIAIDSDASVGASAINSVAMGPWAMVNPNVIRAVALGQGSVADTSNTVSVGSSGNERRIVNVAAGTNATDAVNKAQLDAVDSTASTPRRPRTRHSAMRQHPRQRPIQPTPKRPRPSPIFRTR